MGAGGSVSAGQWVEPELPVACANADIQGLAGKDTLTCRRWLRGSEMYFRTTCAMAKGRPLKIGEIIKEEGVGT